MNRYTQHLLDTMALLPDTVASVSLPNVGRINAKELKKELNKLKLSVSILPSNDTIWRYHDARGVCLHAHADLNLGSDPS